MVGWCLVFKASKSYWFPLARGLHPGVYSISHPPARSELLLSVSPLFVTLISVILGRAEYASNARTLGQDTGPRTAEFRCLPPQTGAESIIQAVPQLLDPEQEFLQTEAKSDRGDDVLISQLSEVKEACEFEESCGTALSQVKGSLRRQVEFWHSIGAPRYILSVICEGYRLPFLQISPGFTSRNNRSALDHSVFVNEAILELLHSARVMELKRPPHVVNPLSVSIQPNGKKRLILDLRCISNFLIKRRVKYEDWTIALSYFQKGSFMITFDLKSGYNHNEIIQIIIGCLIM